MNRAHIPSDLRRRHRVYILSNDVVPGMGVPVSAPGLRSRGMADGLRSHGFAVTEIVPDRVIARRWQGAVPPSRPSDVIPLAAPDISGYLSARAPAIVIAINSNQIDSIPELDSLPIIVDLFAPRILEVACQSPEYPAEEVAAMRSRDIRAMGRGRSFIVNGAKKIPFYLAWLMQTDRDPRQVVIDVVPMPMAKGFDDSPPVDAASSGRPVRMVSAGYLQGWSRPGPWYPVVSDLVGDHAAEFHVAVVAHRGGNDGVSPDGDELSYFDHPAVRTYETMLYDDYVAFMSSMDVAIDLFANSLERPYAMVTRTVGAISCGLPVIHPPWTETAEYIGAYDAGWLVDPEDRIRLGQVVTEALNDHDLRRAKAENARRLWREVFNPVEATRPLVDQIDRLQQALDHRLGAEIRSEGDLVASAAVPERGTA